ncbi:calcineurin-like phosphoesterase family protein [Virgibacillus halotolerans]|uniref:hypothetical protein n=1 Tax=Virgibacillus halotolerans TaxID=1071053 RepID=UPI00195F7E93|nr:hypothetical protein [Virgibacillus halotolerans]MBM7598178.1 calcineurin-like phosphoesterase family protein [Virgibacillus halotolerans]
MATYFTSDQHFYHRNVLKFEDRPFDSVDEMNQGMIDAWNDTVRPSDTIHHLGDFCFGGYDKWVSILDQLDGKIILYKGNHDDSKTLKKLVQNGYFEYIHHVGDYFKINGYQLWLTHYPMEIGMRPRKFSLHGHIHSTPSNMLNQVNLGVDSPLNFNRRFGQPISEHELVEYLDYINPLVESEFQKERSEWNV